MKTSYVLFLAMAGLSRVAMANSSVLITAPVDKVFVPNGFDDNDKVEVIVYGHFTSNCYKMGPVNSFIDDVTKKITISAQAFYYQGGTCIQMITPFIKSVELNRHLAIGQYTVAVADRPKVKTSGLTITKAHSPDPDDYIYAAVNNAVVETNTSGVRELVLKGQHPFLLDGCMKFDEVRSYRGIDNTIVVQPITKIVYGDECKGSVNNRFEYRMKFANDLTKGDYLMHVRALDGNALNQLLQFN